MNLMYTNVAGVTFNNRQSKIYYIWRNLQKDQASVYVSLRRNPTNEYDKNAIQVLGHVRGGSTVDLGFIDKNLATELAPLMDSGKRVWVKNFTIKYNQNYPTSVRLGVEF